jgi:hypothetical protein
MREIHGVYICAISDRDPEKIHDRQLKYNRKIVKNTQLHAPLPSMVTIIQFLASSFCFFQRRLIV